ncbi:MAG: NADH-quinone oxidoreductase subunit C [Clostridiales bacterium]|nr:NADH-quinone oxidoreductase subunit C [Clostridiales bacterium]
MENEVLQKIAERFPSVAAEQAVVKHHRIYLSVPNELLVEALSFCYEELNFRHLCTITGLDNGKEYELLYHISKDDGLLLTLKRTAPYQEPVVIPTVLSIYQGATFYERELEGLLGIKVEGLPEGRQYPLPDNWPQGEYPLRKSWKPKQAGGAGQEASV